MADASGGRDVAARLRALDLEFAEGDITQKGYEKRRAALLRELSETQHLQDARHDAAPPLIQQRRGSASTIMTVNPLMAMGTLPHPHQQQMGTLVHQHPQMPQGYRPSPYPPPASTYQSPYPTMQLAQPAFQGTLPIRPAHPQYYGQQQPYAASQAYPQYAQQTAYANASYGPPQHQIPFAVQQQFRPSSPALSFQQPYSQPQQVVPYQQQQQAPMAPMQMQTMMQPQYSVPTFRPIVDLDYAHTPPAATPPAYPPQPQQTSRPQSYASQANTMPHKSQRQPAAPSPQHSMPSQHPASINDGYTGSPMFANPIATRSDSALPQVNVSDPSPHERSKIAPEIGILAATEALSVPDQQQVRLPSSASQDSLAAPPSDAPSSPQSSAQNSPRTSIAQLGKSFSPALTNEDLPGSSVPSVSGLDLSIQTKAYQPLDPNYASAEIHTPRQAPIANWAYSGPSSAYTTLTPQAVAAAGNPSLADTAGPPHLPLPPPPLQVQMDDPVAQGSQSGWSPNGSGTPLPVLAAFLSLPREHHHAHSPTSIGPIIPDPIGTTQQTMPTVPDSAQRANFEDNNTQNNANTSTTSETEFTSIAMMLRQRAHEHVGSKDTSFVMLDQRNRDLGSFTFERLYHRALRVAEMLREKPDLKRGTPVALLFRRTDWLDFLSALFGCFIAGVVAVPLVTSSLTVTEELAEIEFILETSQLGLCLTTDTNIRLLTKLYTTNHGAPIPKLEWWRINEFGSYQFTKKAKGPDGIPEDPSWVTSSMKIKPDDIAYIEYVKNAYGEVKGVAVHHDMIISQCSVFQDTYGVKISDIIGLCLEPRQHVGLLLSAFVNVYAGCTSVLVSESTLTTSGSWSNCIKKHGITLFATDAQWTYRLCYTNKVIDHTKKGMTSSTSTAVSTSPTDLVSLRAFVVNTESLTARLDDTLMFMFTSVGWAGPHILSVLVTLNEFGGAILASDRGPNGRVGTGMMQHELHLADIRSYRYKPMVGAEPEPDMQKLGTITVLDSGLVTSQASVAIVNDSTGALVDDGFFGEIWVHAPNLPKNLWKLPKLSEKTLCAHPTIYVAEGASPPSGFPLAKVENDDSNGATSGIGSSQSTLLRQLTQAGSITTYSIMHNYVRTGLYGYVINISSQSKGGIETRLVVLGCARDIVFQRQTRQYPSPNPQLPPPSQPQQPYMTPPQPQHQQLPSTSRPERTIRIYFANLIYQKLSMMVPNIDCFTVFDISLQNEFMPVVMIEMTPPSRTLSTAVASGSTANASGSTKPAHQYPAICSQVYKVMYTVFGIRPFSIMICRPGTLPRMYPDTVGGSGFQTLFSGFDMPSMRRVLLDSFHVVGGHGSNSSSTGNTTNGGNSSGFAVVLISRGEEIAMTRVTRLDVETCRRMFLEGRCSPVYVEVSGHSDVYGSVMHVPGSTVYGSSSQDPNTAITSIGAGVDNGSDPSQAATSGLLQIMGSTKTIPVLDDHTGKDLTTFTNLIDLLMWRVETHPDIPAYTQLDPKPKRDAKPLSFLKFSTRIQSVSKYLAEKHRLGPGDNVIVMCTPSGGYDDVVTIWACLYAGIIAIPMPPLDISRLKEDIPALLKIVDALSVKAIVVNAGVEEDLKSRAVRDMIKTVQLQKQQAQKEGDANAASDTSGAGASSSSSVGLPSIINITPRVAKTTQKISKEDGVYQPRIHKRGLTCIIWITFDDDMRATWTRVSHDTLMEMCRIQSIQCKLFRSVVMALSGTASGNNTVVSTSDSVLAQQYPFMSSVRVHAGLGFLHSVVMGVYTGHGTVHVSPMDYYMTPNIYFDALHTYHVKHAFITYPVLDHAISVMRSGEYRSFSMHGIENLVLPVGGYRGGGSGGGGVGGGVIRPLSTTHQGLLMTMRQNRVSPHMIGVTYTSLVNPCISTRMSMASQTPISVASSAGVSVVSGRPTASTPGSQAQPNKPITLWLDAKSLRDRRVIAYREIQGQDEQVVQRHIISSATNHAGTASRFMDTNDLVPPSPDIIAVQDTGTITNNTFVAIVDTKRMRICGPNEVGEVWVCSGGTVDGLDMMDVIEKSGNSDANAPKKVPNARKASLQYGMMMMPVSVAPSSSEPPSSMSSSTTTQTTANTSLSRVGTGQFEQTLPGIDPSLKFVRTGDIGFLWPVSTSSGNVASRQQAQPRSVSIGANTTIMQPETDVDTLDTTDTDLKPLKPWDSILASPTTPYEMCVFTIGSIDTQIEVMLDTMMVDDDVELDQSKRQQQPPHMAQQQAGMHGMGHMGYGYQHQPNVYGYGHDVQQPTQSSIAVVYPDDIESTVESSVPGAINTGGCVMFTSKSYGTQYHHIPQPTQSNGIVYNHLIIECASVHVFANAVPHIVVAVMDRHGVLIHTVMVVQPGMILRSRGHRVQRRCMAQAFEDGVVPVLGVMVVGKHGGGVLVTE